MSMSRRRTLQITGPARALALAALGCSASGAHDAIELRYTEYGIAHVRASNYQDLGFGQGYAQARDNACDIEHGMLAFEGRLSRYFGPDAAGSSLTGTGTKSLASDLYYQGIADSGVVEALVARPPPLGPRDEVRQLVRGYVEGFNALLAEQPSLGCRDAEWLRPMAELDVYRRAYAMSTYLGRAVFLEQIIAAAPPVATPAALSESRAREALLASPSPRSRPGSNAIAIGGALTDTGGGINVANPHLAWNGDLRWSQAQLTLPGELDVSGAAVLGLPLIVMGHTATAAWSITTAEASRRFTLFELQLSDDSPTTYLVDGLPERMQRQDVSVQVRRDDGTLETITHEQWSTRYGPVVSGDTGALAWVASSPGLPGHAYAVGDANATNMRMLNTLLALDHSGSVGDVERALRDNQGAPWWTVVAADAAGQALFSQIHVVPNVPDAHAERCGTEATRDSFPFTGVVILDGSRGDCAWLTDPDAIEPGIFGPGQADDPHLPLLVTRGYVANSNGSYWQPNAEQRISGLARIVGDEATERSLRTRDTFTEIEDQLAQGPFDRQAMQELVFSHRSYAAELVLDDTLALCSTLPDGAAESSDGLDVDVREACDVLARWDRRMNADSRGALLFDRYWRTANALAAEAEVSLFSTPFDAGDPLATPRTLDSAGPIPARALADAVLGLSDAGIALAAELGAHQYAVRGGVKMPLGGGTDVLGVFDVLDSDWSPEHGYSAPFANGSGYLHVVQFDGTPCPDAVSLVTYSQSVESSSPHHGDQTALYSQKRWVSDRFCEADILASPELELIRLERD
jgi:acyl-homoserine-lactone acylase